MNKCSHVHDVRSCTYFFGEAEPGWGKTVRPTQSTTLFSQSNTIFFSLILYLNRTFRGTDCSGLTKNTFSSSKLIHFCLTLAESL